MSEPNRYVHAPSVIMQVVPPEYYERHRDELQCVYVTDEDYRATLTARDQRIAELEGETFGRLQVIEACGETMCEQQARTAELEGLLREWLNKAIHPTGDLASRTERQLALTQETRG